jgi:hypothetical protein
MKHVSRALDALSSSFVQVHRPSSRSRCSLQLGGRRLQASSVSATIDDAAKCSLRVG